MSAYNTGNPVPSTDPRDLDDNATNLDKFVNGGALTYPDRLGVARKSYAGIEADVEALLGSPNLSALAGLSGAADSLPYFTGAGALSLTTLTALARTFNSASNAAGQAAALPWAAPKASPTFTGVPEAPTAGLGTNTTQLATMAAIIASMLGTVSQASGTPTGSAMEYTTSAQGDCFRFASGLQVTFIDKTLTATNQAAGPLWTSVSNAVGAFTKPFIATPVIVPLGQAPANGGWAAYYDLPTPKGANNWGSWAVYSHVTSATPAKISLVAFGRWF